MSERFEDLCKALDHSYAAYRFAVGALPAESCFRGGEMVNVAGLDFRSLHQVEAILVELGWAFFVRMEASLEAFLIKTSRSREVTWHALLECALQKLTPDEIVGYKTARELRNTLHHGDGDSALLDRAPQFVVSEDGMEPHILPTHIDQFKELFLRIADTIEKECFS